MISFKICSFLLEQSDILRPKKKNLDLILTIYTKIKSKWIIDLNGKWKIISCLEKQHRKGFLDLIPA